MSSFFDAYTITMLLIAAIGGAAIAVGCTYVKR